jgi:hypothetical protein
MLEDGEPSTPIVLNWTNESWAPRWNGNDASKVSIKQPYGGIDAWRRHFEWVLRTSAIQRTSR